MADPAVTKYVIHYDWKGQHGTLADFHNKREAVKAMNAACDDIKAQGGTIWIERQTSTEQ